MIAKQNYTESPDAGFLKDSQSSAEQTTMMAVDQFSYYTVKDRDSRFLLEFNYWIQAFLFKLVPCILLTALTVMLIVAMHQANVRRMKLKSQVTIARFCGHYRPPKTFSITVNLDFLTFRSIATTCLTFWKKH